ncbi:MAG: hypothetical protein VB127_08055 [Sphaerochaeta sp.]|nr:hypothetical protein [Sphaerochaeta sp.]
MRQTLLLLGLLVLLSPLGAATLALDADPTIDAKVVSLVEQALRQSMLPRLGPDGQLDARLETTKAVQAYLLTLTYGERSIFLDVGYEVETLGERLASQLDQDGLALLGELKHPHLEYRLGSGFASSDKLEVGHPYWVLDGQGLRVGQVVTTKYHADKELSFLSQRGGKPLGLGMQLVGMSPFSTALSASLDQAGRFGIDVRLSYALARYPFYLVANVGYAQPGLSHVDLGLQSLIPLSHLFGTKHHLGRTLSLGAQALVGIGLGLAESLTLRSEGLLFLSYQLGSFALMVGGGNRIGADSLALVEEGLFFSVGTAYTYTP